MTVMPNSQASAADMRPGPPPPPHRIGMAGPGFHGTFDFSHRVQAMVRDGKITQDQAFKLYDEMKRFERKGQRDHRRFMHKLPEREIRRLKTAKSIVRRRLIAAETAGRLIAWLCSV